MSARRQRRRGTTFVELLVYIGLLTSGMLVLGGLELAAQRALTMQQALIDIDLESIGLLGALRRDVEAARRLELDPAALVVERHDGATVRYERGARVESRPGAEPRREPFPTNSDLRVSLESALGGKPLVVVEATFRRETRDGAVSRSYRRVASPRGEVGQ